MAKGPRENKSLEEGIDSQSTRSTILKGSQQIESCEEATSSAKGPTTRRSGTAKVSTDIKSPLEESSMVNPRKTRRSTMVNGSSWNTVPQKGIHMELAPMTNAKTQPLGGLQALSENPVVQECSLLQSSRRRTNSQQEERHDLSRVTDDANVVLDTMGWALASAIGQTTGTRSEPPRDSTPAQVMKDNKGAGRAIEPWFMEDMTGDGSHSDISSSPPVIQIQDFTLDIVTDPDGSSSTSSLYGDENLLPCPTSLSLPKPYAERKLETPPKPLYYSSEEYTPPSPYRLWTSITPVAGPLAATSFSDTPLQSRSWESCSAKSSADHPRYTSKAACDVVEFPQSFDIYEDSGRMISPQPCNGTSTACKGDMCDNVLLTPKQDGRIDVKKKRMGSEGKRTRAGQNFKDPNEDQVNGSGNPRSGPLFLAQNATAAHDSKPKRQKHEPEAILTRQLLDLAPRRRRTEESRFGVSKLPPVDDLGDDVTSGEEEGVGNSLTLISGGDGVLSKRHRSTPQSLQTCVFPQPDSRIDHGNQGVGYYLGNRSVRVAFGGKENDLGIKIGSAGSQRLKSIQEAFEKVDQWQMEFEDVNIERSSEV